MKHAGCFFVCLGRAHAGGVFRLPSCTPQDVDSPALALVIPLDAVGLMW